MPSAPGGPEPPKEVDMTNKRSITIKSLIATGLLAAIVTTGYSAIAGDADGARANPVRCEITAEDNRGLVRLSGLMHADTEVSGTYRFKVESAGRGGNTNISQGSSFFAGPNGPTTLGMVMLSSGGVYDVELNVTADGTRYSCSQRIGGLI